MLIVEPGNPRTPDAMALLESSHRLMHDLFAPEDIYALDIDALCASNIHVFMARENKVLLGIGALAVQGSYGEVKSMFTAPQARGRGVAAAILRQIEDQARVLGLRMLKLETGEALGSAIRLYMRHGFTRCGIFGAYTPNGTSVFMQKPLA